MVLFHKIFFIAKINWRVHLLDVCKSWSNILILCIFWDVHIAFTSDFVPTAWFWSRFALFGIAFSSKAAFEFRWIELHVRVSWESLHLLNFMLLIYERYWNFIEIIECHSIQCYLTFWNWIGLLSVSNHTDNFNDYN